MSPGSCPIVVGRADELAALNEALERAAGGAGGVVALVGEAGIGKSRLARELTVAAGRRGFRFLCGRAVEGGDGVAFRALIEALLAYFRDRTLPSPPELAPFRPALSRLIPAWRAETDPAASPVVLCEGVLRLLNAVAGSHGCLLLLEDLQWADPDTLAVVEYLADHVVGLPLLCAVTLRSDEGSEGLRLVRSIAARRCATVVEVGPLTAAEVAAMANACAGADVPAEYALLLHARSDGVPFIVEELLAGNADWEPARLSLPRSVAQIVQHRVDRMGARAGPVLRAGALCGDSFDWRLVASASGEPERVVLDTLRGASAAGLVRGDTDHPDRFRFRHDLTREAIVDAMLPPERAELAARVMSAVEAAHGELEAGWVEVMANLAAHTGDRARSARLLYASGRRSLDEGALATAEQTLSRARELAHADDPVHVDVLEALAEAQALAGKPDQVAATGAGLVRALSRSGDSSDRLARAHLSVARAALAAERWDAAEASLVDARVAAPSDDMALRSRADAVAAQVALGRGELEDAERLARRALDSAAGRGLHEVECEALEVVGRCARLQDLERARRVFQQARAVADEAELTVWRIRALHELGTVDLLQRGHGPIPALEEARSLAFDYGALSTAAVLDLQIAAGYATLFEARAVLDTAQRCLSLSVPLRLDPVQAMAYVFAATAHASLGARADMEAAIGRALVVGGDHPDVIGAAWGWARAIYSLAHEHRRSAATELDRAMDAVRDARGAAPAPFRGLWALVRAVEDVEAEAAVREVRESGATVHRVVAAFVELAIAVVSGRSGSSEAACSAFAAGDALLGELPWLRYCGRRLVAEAAVADGWGDPASWLGTALEFFEARREPRLASACRSLLRRAGAPAPVRRSRRHVSGDLATHGVTDRELEVLQLLAGGVSNREIAERLFLSPRTVERHVANIATKVGVPTRSQLVAYAARVLAPEMGDA